MRRFVLPLAFLLLTASPLRLWADASPLSPPQGAIYLGTGRMLEAQAPRQLSLNAHVRQFAYQPGGLSIAYAGATQDGDTLTQFVRLVGLKHATVTTLLTQTQSLSQDVDPLPGYILAGWSADARYLVVEGTQAMPAPDRAETLIVPTYTCVDIGVSPVRLRPIALPQAPSSVLTDAFWSPDHTRLLFVQATVGEKADVCSLYDPVQDRLTTFALPKGQHLRGWLDAGSLRLVSYAEGPRFTRYDLATGRQADLPPPGRMPSEHAPDGIGPSPKSPNLTLDVEERFHPDKQGVTGIDSHLLWVRRTWGAKKMSAMPVGLTPGEVDPQAHWSPRGRQVAFIAHGDLFVTDLTERDARATEKLAAGEKLTCAEEREIATSNLKQIGLGIFQYVQDNDERFPQGDDFKNKVLPYIKNDSIFGIDGHPFVYHAPPSPSLAAMDAPAEFVLGTMDLPCARVTLYADGHVKALPKTQDAPRKGGE